jgi:PIN domain nuclease of toxin-antitoxin system
MPLVLDTHSFLWFVSGDERLPLRCREAIGGDGVRVFVSAAVAWEIGIKHALGKLPGAASIANDMPRAIEENGFAPLDITVAHAQRAGALPPHHNDPFDRMLVAQALAEDLVLVSNETIFDRYGVRRLW